MSLLQRILISETALTIKPLQEIALKKPILSFFYFQMKIAHSFQRKNTRKNNSETIVLLYLFI